MSTDHSIRGVNIGSISGGVHSSVIAGRDVSNATITLGGREVRADAQPTVDDLQRLLTELSEELAAISAQRDALEQVSPSAKLMAQGAHESVRDAAEKLGRDLAPGEAQSVKKTLTEAASLVGLVLDGARAGAEKAGDAAGAVGTMVQKLEPLLQKIGVAALWVGRLWLS